ncbi:hypothetical protein [Cohnella fermenti]|uniref:Exosporium leader peptide n=1 Tax=Cohnella fermenti TaxID=2565925 RepID=A0A4S4BFU3_9BACL|nr:hypothetical protein [Cohnella fermenti]THF73248.1 hypothetical protein E6C55_29930 [Cohnella fermenti]
MGAFLDLRSSMNSSQTGFPNVPLTTAPALFGVIGLQTQNKANTVINLTGTVGISDPIVGNTFTIEVLRGTTTYNAANVIYSATLGIRVSLFGDIYSFTAQDLLAPAAAETIYSAFISGGPLIILSGVRSGPEVFWGVASQGAP